MNYSHFDKNDHSKRGIICLWVARCRPISAIEAQNNRASAFCHKPDGEMAHIYFEYLISQSGIFVPGLAVYSFSYTFSSLVGLKKA
jgi:hypothetical protein